VRTRAIIVTAAIAILASAASVCAEPAHAATTTMGSPDALAEVRAAASRLEEKTGSKWLVILDDIRAAAKTVRGSYPTGADVRDEQSADVVSRAFLDEHQDLLKARTDQLTLSWFEFNTVLNRARVDYQEEYRGIRVEGGMVKVFIREDGTLYSVVNDFYPGIDVSVAPALSGEAALQIVRGLDPSEAPGDEEVELVILPIRDESSISYVLCWKVKLDRHTHFIDAQNGVEVERWSNYRR